jgi:hypothetical protein
LVIEGQKQLTEDIIVFSEKPERLNFKSKLILGTPNLGDTSLYWPIGIGMKT